ncbi:hypothetical protein C0134_06190 [Moraxella catarrhalis]|uniref:hypothetical protein n=1 Tax=Moraxella catarrhalis TaxID=480 RepID=UPI0007218277|nr:hypothetical protein [Moraxella catarrhalis]AKI27777.1 hypothetical protein [Moraxella phage Mcat18]AKI27947.1 hypothetical protein [Moraxella phage Mcat22]MCG6832593.1 hypothetical protein [Moraxella catarrhalis]MPW83095.1 hypothetical protein [Moraxella catarrhalis]MPX20987.1 hypothetical protein [Moraxella catarrhalis]
MNHVIRLLQPECFQTFKGWVSQNNINPVFVASIKPIKNDKLRDVYCKIYPFTNTDRSLFNEIVGYLVAHALKIPQPNHAYIALLETKDILANDHGNLDVDLKKLMQETEYYPVFCTEKIDKSQTAFDFINFAPSLTNEIAKWKYLPDTLAMDNTIANTDRHLNNILRTGKNTYHIIDNGRLVAEDGTPWKVADLDCHKNYTNKLWKYSEQYLLKSWKTISSNIMHACSLHPVAVQSITDELDYWVKVLYQEQQMDYNAFTQFLLNRANDSQFYHARRLNILI